MRKRHVFATPSLPVAEAVVQAARSRGISSDCIFLEAKSDVEVDGIVDERKNVSMDFAPAAWHGTLIGAAAGFLAGLGAMVIPAFSLSFGGAAALTVVGALVGTWVSGLIGSSLPDEVRRTFRGRIEAGQILVVIDAMPEAFASAEAAIADAGGTRLPYETNTALT